MKMAGRNFESQPFYGCFDKTGIRYHGCSHSTLIYDFDGDGWMDILRHNDFFEQRFNIRNNKNGTFTHVSIKYSNTFSHSAMGE
jgi:hypothetical protein